MPSVSVYLNESLAEAVHRLGVSVSSVGRAALLDEVRRLEALERFESKGAVREGAQRLRVARGTETQDESTGYECGLDWALHSADETELRTLVEVSRRPWVELAVSQPEWPTLFAELEHLDGRPSPGDIHWEREPFIVGFVRGAVEAYWAMLAV